MCQAPLIPAIRMSVTAPAMAYGVNGFPAASPAAPAIRLALPRAAKPACGIQSCHAQRNEILPVLHANCVGLPGQTNQPARSENDTDRPHRGPGHQNRHGDEQNATKMHKRRKAELARRRGPIGARRHDDEQPPDQGRPRRAGHDVEVFPVAKHRGHLEQRSTRGRDVATRRLPGEQPDPQQCQQPGVEQQHGRGQRGEAATEPVAGGRAEQADRDQRRHRAETKTKHRRRAIPR